MLLKEDKTIKNNLKIIILFLKKMKRVELVLPSGKVSVTSKERTLKEALNELDFIKFHNYLKLQTLNPPAPSFQILYVLYKNGLLKTEKDILNTYYFIETEIYPMVQKNKLILKRENLENLINTMKNSFTNIPKPENNPSVKTFYDSFKKLGFRLENEKSRLVSHRTHRYLDDSVLLRKLAKKMINDNNLKVGDLVQFYYNSFHPTGTQTGIVYVVNINKEPLLVQKPIVLSDEELINKKKYGKTLIFKPSEVIHMPIIITKYISDPVHFYSNYFLLPEEADIITTFWKPLIAYMDIDEKLYKKIINKDKYTLKSRKTVDGKSIATIGVWHKIPTNDFAPDHRYMLQHRWVPPPSY